MFQAAQSHDHLDPDRISFTLSVQTMRDVVILATQTPPCLLEHVVQQVYACLVLKGSLVEPRRLRFNCRVVKRICTRFRRKHPEHVNLYLKDTELRRHSSYVTGIAPCGRPSSWALYLSAILPLAGVRRPGHCI